MSRRRNMDREYFAAMEKADAEDAPRREAQLAAEIAALVAKISTTCPKPVRDAYVAHISHPMTVRGDWTAIEFVDRECSDLGWGFPTRKKAALALGAEPWQADDRFGAVAEFRAKQPERDHDDGGWRVED